MKQKSSERHEPTGEEKKMKRDNTEMLELHAAQRPAAVDGAMVERATMALLGKSHDTAPGIDWRCDRAWTVNKVRKHMRAALAAALAAQQPPAEAQPVAQLYVSDRMEELCPVAGMEPGRLRKLLGNGTHNLYTAPPSAPVGVPYKQATYYADGVYGPDDLAAAWNACVNAHKTLAQQPAAVDEEEMRLTYNAWFRSEQGKPHEDFWGFGWAVWKAALAGQQGGAK